MKINEWKGKVIRLVNKKVYFFNEEGIYTKISIIDAKKLKLKYLGYDRRTGEYYREYSSEYFFNRCSISEERAIACLRIGDNIEKFQKDIERFKKIYETDDFNLTNTVVRISRKKFYFFDENGKYTYLTEKEILPSNVFIGNIIITIKGNVVYSCNIQRHELARVMGTDNMNLLKIAIGKLQIGDTIQTLKEYYDTANLGSITLPEGVQRFVTKISKPEFVCTPENPNKDNTFDYIHIYVGIVSEWETDRKKYIMQNREEINNMVLARIRNDKRFLKYGVPENVLKLSKVILVKRTSELHYIFQLKNID